MTDPLSFSGNPWTAWQDQLHVADNDGLVAEGARPSRRDQLFESDDRA